MTEENKKTILLVDDDNFLLDMYATKFSKEGFGVESAQDATQALTKLEEGLNPDICLFDIVMPDMSGLDLLSQVREKGLAKDTVVIMLTNQVEKENIDRAKELGATGYIVKATTVPSEVVEEVRKMYEEKKGK